MIEKIHSTRQSFTRLRKDEQMRHRDIAHHLGISEGELIAAHVGIESMPSAIGTIQAIRLRSEWPEIISSVESLGEVMGLTRNNACVHEKIGIYQNVSKDGPVGILIGEIELRIFYRSWVHGFAVCEMGKEGMHRSLQFFDNTGMAIHKIQLKPQSFINKYEELVIQFKNHDQSPEIQVGELDKLAAELPDQDIDISRWHQAWRAMKDTHDFFVLLRKFKLTRTQGLRLAEPEFAQELPVTCIKDLLELAVSTGTSIMVFVGNAGMIQIHSGPINKVVSMGTWINVMDSRFNLHLRADNIVKVWVVRKPTLDGIVTSVELFDSEGEAIVMFFGERKPGVPELEKWRSLVQDLVTKSRNVGA
ncbi:hemin-degrading factor [Polynucleobacter sp. CS-Odin-A6]|uniref:hemin-degrading factor n=1 Tax=Polynucleobacter sp. CS-Odin-A6 TaxID=2689106 RepID=UPI001C0E4226|nr:ChuX/HutX family heme-like substrate-binding protein [Polynucleobacter sp. CS-Odin-A6]MBU3621547.1 hemin-degrading factor [Polynucleobacter sp. CS-Odin-A6]